MGQGDILLLYTDGLTDAFSAFTQKRMERTLIRAREKPAQEICKAIIEERGGPADQIDDLSLVVIKRE